MVVKLAFDMRGELLLRILTALMGAPAVIGAIFYGSPYLDILIFLVTVAMLREWSRLTTSLTFHPFSIVAMAHSAVLLYGTQLNNEGALLMFLILLGLTFWGLYKTPSMQSHKIYLIGTLYICISMMIFYSFSKGSQALKYFSLWLIVLVWLNDIGAYFFGRVFKGPKLACQISPNKTWSGCIGGTFFATCVGYYLAIYFKIIDVLNFYPIFVIILISLAAHIGDLLESYIKRYFGVKDTGHGIPGHGGFLDRLDSILLVNIVCGLLFVTGILKK